MAGRHDNSLDGIAAQLRRTGLSVLKAAERASTIPVQHSLPGGIHFDDRDADDTVRRKRRVIDDANKLDNLRAIRRVERTTQSGQRWLLASEAVETLRQAFEDHADSLPDDRLRQAVEDAILKCLDVRKPVRDKPSPEESYLDRTIDFQTRALAQLDADHREFEELEKKRQEEFDEITAGRLRLSFGKTDFGCNLFVLACTSDRFALLHRRAYLSSTPAAKDFIHWFPERGKSPVACWPVLRVEWNNRHRVLLEDFCWDDTLISALRFARMILPSNCETDWEIAAEIPTETVLVADAASARCRLFRPDVPKQQTLDWRQRQ